MRVKIVGQSPYSIKSASLHCHNDWEIVLNLEGEGLSVIGSKEYPFAPGTIICQPKGIPHSKHSRGRFKDIFMRVDEFINPANEEVPVFADDEEKSFETLMLLALRVFHKKEPNYAATVNSLYESMYQMLVGWSNFSEPKNIDVERFKNHLINDFTNPEFHISDAMKIANYCTDHFRRCFKRETGLTPIAYLTNLRIEYAKKLLRRKEGNEMAISDIAFLSGFYDPRYFSRTFKKIVGVTPQEYTRHPLNRA